MNDETIPILDAEPAFAGGHDVWRVWCVHCTRWHQHGGGEGHRVAHCGDSDSPYLETGYILRLRDKAVTR